MASSSLIMCDVQPERANAANGINGTSRSPLKDEFLTILTPFSNAQHYLAQVENPTRRSCQASNQSELLNKVFREKRHAISQERTIPKTVPCPPSDMVPVLPLLCNRKLKSLATLNFFNFTDVARPMRAKVPAPAPQRIDPDPPVHRA
jgi:hypothetical protein